MRPPTTKGTLVTLHDGRVVQAVKAVRTPIGTPRCLGCVGGDTAALCNALQSQCGESTHGEAFIFINNTPEAMAEYVLALLGEQP